MSVSPESSRKDNTPSLVWGVLGTKLRALNILGPSSTPEKHLKTKMPSFALGVPDACHTRVPALEAWSLNKDE